MRGREGGRELKDTERINSSKKQNRGDRGTKQWVCKINKSNVTWED